MVNFLLKLVRRVEGELVLSKVNILMWIEFVELWECDKEINNLNPILDPLTIITNIIIKEDIEILRREEDNEK